VGAVHSIIRADFGLTADVRLGGDSGNAGPLLMVSAGNLMSEETDKKSFRTPAL
jgi:hypothetical protein